MQGKLHRVLPPFLRFLHQSLRLFLDLQLFFFFFLGASDRLCRQLRRRFTRRCLINYLRDVRLFFMRLLILIDGILRKLPGRTGSMILSRTGLPVDGILCQFPGRARTRFFLLLLPRCCVIACLRIPSLHLHLLSFQTLFLLSFLFEHLRDGLFSAVPKLRRIERILHLRILHPHHFHKIFVDQIIQLRCLPGVERIPVIQAAVIRILRFSGCCLIIRSFFCNLHISAPVLRLRLRRKSAGILSVRPGLFIHAGGALCLRGLFPLFSCFRHTASCSSCSACHSPRHAPAKSLFYHICHRSRSLLVVHLLKCLWRKDVRRQCPHKPLDGVDHLFLLFRLIRTSHDIHGHIHDIIHVKGRFLRLLRSCMLCSDHIQ